MFLVLTRSVEGNKEVLLQRRCNTGYMDGKYDMASSGHLEAGETLAMVVVREAKEEHLFLALISIPKNLI